MSTCTCSGLKHDDWGYHSDYCPVYMAGYIKELEMEIESQDQWIPVGERLPEIDQMVLLWPSWQPSLDMATGYRYEHNSGAVLWNIAGTHGYSDSRGVTHWQPLPTPPIEG